MDRERVQSCDMGKLISKFATSKQQSRAGSAQPHTFHCGPRWQSRETQCLPAESCAKIFEFKGFQTNLALEQTQPFDEKHCQISTRLRHQNLVATELPVCQ
jgi:hypothetical protein